ncbi:MAG TPA: shikimate kinase [Bacteroidales bacterium]|nr:shikimate kinase [Bacteroidales bacterium]
MRSARKVYIVGFMGSGKTTAGKKLANIMGSGFYDLDKVIEQKSGMDIPGIFAHHGEDYFRTLEAEILRELSVIKDGIISTGGGAPCFRDNMDFMCSDGITVYLKMTPAQLRERILNSKTERPLIAGLGREDLLSFIEKKLAERERFYNMAEIVFDGFDPDIRKLYELITSVPH